MVRQQARLRREILVEYVAEGLREIQKDSGCLDLRNFVLIVDEDLLYYLDEIGEDLMERGIMGMKVILSQYIPTGNFSIGIQGFPSKAELKVLRVFREYQESSPIEWPE